MTSWENRRHEEATAGADLLLLRGLCVARMSGKPERNDFDFDFFSLLLLYLY